MKLPRTLLLVWLAIAPGSVMCEEKSVSTDSDEFPGAEDPPTMKRRLVLAGKGRTGMNVPFLIYVDSIDDRVATRWGEWPVRIFVLGADGTVLYRAGTGACGFNPGLGFKPVNLESLVKRSDRFSEEFLEDFLCSFRLGADRSVAKES